MAFDFSKNEEKILKFWTKNKIFEKSLLRNKKGKNFVFYEGPPFANGLPGIHHLLARAFKDVVLRYKTMQGFYVERKAGWDTHGLPTEMATEKKLGIKSKRDIEQLGVEKFIAESKRNVFTYKKEWEDFTKRIGYWIDLKNAYITCSNEYIESLWWILKQIWEKGLLYHDYKVVPYCFRCGTSLSSHELAQGYSATKDTSVYVAFKIISDNSRWQDVSVLSWTTTPWTLPGNVALAVGPDLVYVKIKTKNQLFVLAKSSLFAVQEEYEIIEEFKGKDLVDLSYQFLFDVPQLKTERSYKIYPAHFVVEGEGTGVVHTAVMYGEDDYQLGKKVNLPMFHTVDTYGNFIAGLGHGLVGLSVKSKEAEALIIEYLQNSGALFLKKEHEHEYPFCWRCSTPLIYYAKDSWFIKTTALKKELLKNNQKINWVPSHLKSGRFGEWLREVKDWNLSRERYWGVPLPIWQCRECKELLFIGSQKELQQKSKKSLKDLHRPFVDKITFHCKCGKTMKRVPEVIDCWFDSGAMPFAQWHYPFENKNRIDKKYSFPADFICEGIDQTRGWFYTLLAVSTAIGLGAPFKNVISLGLVHDAKGQKMSKSKGNIIAPAEIANTFGIDCARLYFYTLNGAGEFKKVDLKDMQTLRSRFFGTLWNSYIFFATYAPKNFKPQKNFEPKNVLDKWIFSRLNTLNKQLEDNLDKYYIVEAARYLEGFVDDLSNWHIRRSRYRLQGENVKEKEEASQVLYYALFNFIKMASPFIPFIAEEIYQKIAKKFEKHESIHFFDYPKYQKRYINQKVEKEMAQVRDIATQALAQRAGAKIKVRQPLKKLKIKNEKLKIKKELLDLIRDEVNVKEIIFDKKIEKEIELDTIITPELKKEGQIREIIRQIQDMRKKAGLKPNQKVIVFAFGSDFINQALLENKDVILKSANLKDLLIKEKNNEIFKMEIDFEIEGEKLWLAIKK